eukprot:3173433-Prymnesium_polylepis.1
MVCTDCPNAKKHMVVASVAAVNDMFTPPSSTYPGGAREHFQTLPMLPRLCTLPPYHPETLLRHQTPLREVWCTFIHSRVARSHLTDGLSSRTVSTPPLPPCITIATLTGPHEGYTHAAGPAQAAGVMASP